MDRRTFGFIQHAGLDEGLVDIPAHFSAEGVQFPDQMSLGSSPDVRIAGHQSDRIDTHRENNGFQTEPRAGERRLAASMARADDRDIIIFLNIIHTFLFTRFPFIFFHPDITFPCRNVQRFGR